MNCLVLVRGLPGSGKSTFAQALSAVGYAHFEGDMFHMVDGVYRYDSAKAKEAHAWCQAEAFAALATGRSVVVSNTFTRLWEMEPYRAFAKQHGIPVHIVQMTGNYGSVHNVPAEAIERMKVRWEVA